MNPPRPEHNGRRDQEKAPHTPGKRLRAEVSRSLHIHATYDFWGLVRRSEGGVDHRINAFEGPCKRRWISHVPTHMLYTKLSRPARTLRHIEQTHAHPRLLEALGQMGTQESCATCNQDPSREHRVISVLTKSIAIVLED